MQMEVSAAITQVLVDMGVRDPHVLLERPADQTNGDFSSNVAMRYAKEVHKDPVEFAHDIASALPEIPTLERIEVAGPGFLNIFVTDRFYNQLVTRINQEKQNWGKGDNLAGRNIMVEYTDPNPFKEFHIGHLMSNTIGESIARLFIFSGAYVLRANYQGDIGVHVACAIWGMQALGIEPGDAARHGDAYAHGASAYKANEEARAEIDTINKALYERSDEALNNMYDIGRAASLARFEQLYKALGTQFDEYFFESKVGDVGKKIVLDHPQVFPESNGARIFRGEEHGLHTRVFVNAKGLPTYEAKELGLELTKMKLHANLDELVIVTANEITEYFRVIKKAMEQVLPDIAKKLEHIPHGMMKLPEGKMSSRTGNVITGVSLLDELTEEALKRATESRAENPVELSRDVAVAAVKYQILKQSPSKDIVFDKERALSFEGDSGPYLQYTHARAQALVTRAFSEGIITIGVDESEPAIPLVKLLAHFPGVAARAAKERAPQHMAGYLAELASSFNSWYAQGKVLDGTPAAAHKVAVTQAVVHTLKNGLWTLGIEAPEQM